MVLLCAEGLRAGVGPLKEVPLFLQEPDDVEEQDSHDHDDDATHSRQEGVQLLLGDVPTLDDLHRDDVQVFN